MAIQEPERPTMNDSSEDSDDDKPLVFKRAGASSSKPSRSSTEVKKLSSSMSQVANGQSSNSRKGRTNVPLAKASQMKSASGSPQASSSSVRGSQMKSPLGSPLSSSFTGKASPIRSPIKSPVSDSKASSSLEGRSKQILNQTRSGAPRNDVSSLKPEPGPNSDDEDSEDDKPLSFRVRGASSVTGDTNNNVTAPNHAKEEDMDGDDDVPISVRISGKLNPGASGNYKPSGSMEKKPIIPKTVQNGLNAKPKSSVVPNKRPIDKLDSQAQSSAKKVKVSGAATAANVKSAVKSEEKDEDDDHIPISHRIKKIASDTKPLSSKQKVTKPVSSSFKKTDKNKKKMKNSQYVKSTKVQPGSSDGQRKWTTLVHNGVIFPPPYTPHGIKILHKGKPVDLTPDQEEVATMYAVMTDSDYFEKPKFKENFWNDWRKLLGKNHVIQSLDDCDFKPIYEWHQQKKEEKKQMAAEEKKAMKEEKAKQEEKYMWAIVDGVKEKVGNFRVEPPGLFRGRGEHPKMGKLKRRIRPSDITLNIGKDAPIPECPIPGERWKEVKHDNTVTWLAFWNDPINPKEFKYVFLAASSTLKGQSDKEKYEKARKLKDYIHDIRAAYTKDFTSKDKTRCQIAVATYLIDKLALRAGNEKDDDEADTVGCCTLKVSNVECVPPNKIKFDFLGKDSIEYKNTVDVEPLVYKAIGQFRHGKKQSDDLFDLLDTSRLNAHLKELMPGLTAKVFRTYNASITLDDQLHSETGNGDVAEKVVVYNKANKQVAIICNHQRTVSKSHNEQIAKIEQKIEDHKATLKELKSDLDRAKKGKPPLKDADGKQKRNLSPEAIEKKIVSTNQKIEKFLIAKNTKEDMKSIALGTSKINYLDPRITVAWCKRHEVPIEKIFNKSLLAKFAWAMDVDPDFRF